VSVSTNVCSLPQTVAPASVMDTLISRAEGWILNQSTVVVIINMEPFGMGVYGESLMFTTEIWSCGVLCSPKMISVGINKVYSNMCKCQLEEYVLHFLISKNQSICAADTIASRVVAYIG
jgi:hypothetical protein